MNFSDLIKKLDKDLILYETKEEGNSLYVLCGREIHETTCPYCGQNSSSVHSKYTRTILDKPIQEYETKLILTVHKYFCNNEKCSHKTFAERYDFIEEKAVRTNRLNDYISKIGMRNSSMDTARDLKDNFINISVNTILRIIKKTTEK